MAQARLVVSLDGIEDVARELRKRGLDVNRGLEVICHAGAQVVQEAAMRKAPGRIATDIERKTTSKRQNAVTVSVRPGKATRKFAKFVEFGTKPHAIRPRRRRALLINGRFVAWSRHPGARKRPFLRPAYDQNKGRAQQAMGEATKKAGRL